MRMLVVNRKSIMSILTTVLVSISFFVVGCGEAEDDTEVEVVVNSQPSIGAIPDQTVNVGGTMEVKVIITDADVADTHTVKASADNTNVATVSVSGTTLTIKAVAVGTATLTVSVTDDSGQDNTAAVPVTFTLTVNELTYDAGDNIEELPTGFWVPQVVSKASFQIARGGQAVIEFNKDGYIENNGVTYTCVSGGGCRIEGARVTKGTIQVTGDAIKN